MLNENDNYENLWAHIFSYMHICTIVSFGFFGEPTSGNSVG